MMQPVESYQLLCWNWKFLAQAQLGLWGIGLVRLGQALPVETTVSAGGSQLVKI